MRQFPQWQDEAAAFRFRVTIPPSDLALDSRDPPLGAATLPDDAGPGGGSSSLVVDQQ